MIKATSQSQASFYREFFLVQRRLIVQSRQRSVPNSPLFRPSDPSLSAMTNGCLNTANRTMTNGRTRMTKRSAI
jgi:hypothetical protein